MEKQIANGVSLLEALKKQNEISFEFKVVSQEKTANGELVAVLKLNTPLDYVRGSQKIIMADGSLKQLEAFDVDEIKVHEGELGNEGFEVDPVTMEGIFVGSDLTLDISKSNFEVWLRTETFAQAGNKMRNAGRESRLNAVRAKLGGVPETAKVK